MQKFKRVLVANRGEIAIRVFRACHELGIRTVAIYSEEDKGSLFRTKADESYQVGKGKSPIEAYLNIDEIIQLAIKKGVDAIHPGYGFLSENPEFARKCEEAGIVFIGPNAEMMNSLGDKIKSKQVAIKVGVPVIPGIEKPIQTDEEALEAARICGYPVILKASAGGGGRGMRIVRHEADLVREYQSAKSEAKKAFGIDDVFIEKYLENPKHIEVQVLGDNYGNLVHLYERDCSIQRRHQKVIEFSPAFTLTEEKRNAICEDALKIAGAVNYRNAGTCEFLVDKTGQHYFIEMNPRIQVEHTITEMVTGIDLVQSQILLAQGLPLNSDEVGIVDQTSVIPRGYAIQCRITTEDPANNFAPDTGRIDVYRSGSGFGIRLDGGNGFTGAVISPYYDSLLVKATSLGRTWNDAISKSLRALSEMKIQGVKTNIAFLINVLKHETFMAGACNTNFIAENPSLFDIAPKADVEYKVLSFIGEKVVNQTKGFKAEFDVPRVPHYDKEIDKKGYFGTKQILDQQGPKGVVDWIHNQKKLLISDTTMRDAQQSLIATRMRTVDIKKIGSSYSHLANDLFSLEMWGGATFDVAYRFLNESPWERLDLVREKIPNIMLQMLIRGANAVGYKNYPDNVVREFIKESAKRGIDVFRIFDSLNWQKGMEIAIDEVLNTGKIAEACICYTGDILDTYRDKYSLEYYVEKAKAIEKSGAHILCIKDMSALLKPYAATKLIKALKNEVSLPIHLHTHDTTGNGVSSILMAAEAGVDIVDTAMSSMSGLTSQPAMNAVVAALENTERETGLDLTNLQSISDYWLDVRPVYSQFESDLKSTSAEIYKYEIPGGQYSNLKPQVESFGLGHRFGEVKEMFKEVNDLFGDIVKVTPSSKAVGDMAIFMVQNELNSRNILEKGADLAFPDSVVAYFQGMMGQPDGGFPIELQKLVLKGEEPVTCRPGELLPDEDFEAIGSYLESTYHRSFSMDEKLSYALYPKVFEDYLKYKGEHGDFSRVGSDVFFHGMYEGETCEVEIASGKKLIVKLLEIGKVSNVGQVKLIFEVNGNRREVYIKDKGSKFETVVQESIMADPDNQLEVGSSIPGKVVKILVKPGEKVKENQVVAIVEAMKMETSVVVLTEGVVKDIFVKEGTQVKSGELLMKLER
ncbi:MAG: pyruvate carboxylase [Clostridiales bacterium 38-18]|nr:MAG: pyruvate carboxylase [Clostridiales bacterium 38-18]